MCWITILQRTPTGTRPHGKQRTGRNYLISVHATGGDKDPRAYGELRSANEERHLFLLLWIWIVNTIQCDGLFVEPRKIRGKRGAPRGLHSIEVTLLASWQSRYFNTKQVRPA
jgi:hypothetical protein